MTIRKRVILIITGVIIFAIAAPLLLLIAQGYRYDWAENRIVKTGTISIKTDPRGAQVIIDGKDSGSTPHTERFVAPGEHLLELKRDGYLPWQKRITVNEERVTEIPGDNRQTISLLLKDPPTLLRRENVIDIKLSGNSILFIEVLEDQTYLLGRLNLGSENVTTIADGLQLEQPRLLDAREQEALIKTKASIIYVSEEEQLVLEPTITQAELTNSKGEIVILKQDGNLTRFNATTKEEVNLSKSVLAFKQHNDETYYIINLAEDHNQLNKINTLTQIQTISSTLPKAASAEIILSKNKQIFLLLNNDLYQVGEDLAKLNEGVSYAEWQEGSDSIVYGNQNEAWLFDTEQGKNSLLIRTTATIQKPEFNKKNGYFFLSRNGVIEAIELYNFGQGNIY